MSFAGIIFCTHISAVNSLYIQKRMRYTEFQEMCEVCEMQRIVLVFIASLIVLFTGQVQAQEAALQTVFVSGDARTIGEEFGVLVEVRDNDTNRNPIGSAFRVRYTTGSVQLVSANDMELGSVLIQDEVEFDDQGPFIDMLTTSNFGNTNPNPSCATLIFRLLSDAYPRYSVWIEKDPMNDTLVDSEFQSFIVDFDNSETTDILVLEGPGIADFNEDKVVNEKDMLILLKESLQPLAQLDLNADGDMDYKDAFLFAQYWGRVYP